LIARIRAALAPLEELPLWSITRAANILSLQFGERRSAPTEQSPDRIVGTYALHVSCAWRLSGTTGVIAGLDDLYLPADDDDEDFRWDRPGKALADARLRAWVAAHSVSPLAVEQITVDRCGGFALHFPQTFAFEVFPAAGADPNVIREMWRLFQPGDESSHFVYLDQGIE
jgi:hypothetical protein